MEETRHSENCICPHGDHHRWLGFTMRWLVSGFIVAGLLFALRPFLAQQMLVRVSSYVTCVSYDDAIRLCEKIIFIDKTNLRAWSSLGYIYRESGKIDKAIAAYEKAFTLKPEDKSVCFNLGMAYFSRKEIMKAAFYFQRIRSQGPEKAKALVVDIINYYRSALSMLSECYRQSGDTVKAKEVDQEIQKYYPLYGKNKLK